MGASTPPGPNGKPRITRYQRKVAPPPAVVPPVLNPGNTGDLPATIPSKSEIDKVGMGQEVVRLRKAGLTHEEIGQQLGFSATQVSDWLAKYRAMGDEQRMQIHRRSVFNLADNLEETFKDLYDILERVKGQNTELELKTVDRVLKAQERAAALVEKIQMYKENERFKETVLDLLDQEAPGIKAKAFKKLSEFKDGISALRPL